MKQSTKQLNIYLPKDIIFWGFFFSFQSHWLQFLPSSCFFYFINISNGISRVPSKRTCWCVSLTSLLWLSPEVVQTHSSPQTWTWEHTPGSPSYSGPPWKFISIITYPARPLEKDLGQCEQLRYNLNTKRQFRNADHRSRVLPTVPGTSLWILS